MIKTRYNDGHTILNAPEEQEKQMNCPPAFQPIPVALLSQASVGNFVWFQFQLTKHLNGNVLPAGEYSATVYLVFYDVITHNRAMLETQLPVRINVHE